MTLPTSHAPRHRGHRKLCPTVASVFKIEDLQRIDEWARLRRSIPLQIWLALDGLRADEVLCANLSTADRIARWTVTPVQGGRARFAQCSPRRRSWLLNTVADALEALDVVVASCVEST